MLSREAFFWTSASPGSSSRGPHLKELAREIERAWPEEQYDGIVLFGEHAVLEKLRAHLPEQLRSNVAGEARHA